MAPTGRMAADLGPAASRASSQVIAASGCTVILSSVLILKEPFLQLTTETRSSTENKRNRIGCFLRALRVSVVCSSGFRQYR
jgi:hypothetical protein